MKNNFLDSSFLSRIKKLNNHPVNRSNEVVIYYMQASVRSKFNHALECAIAKANELLKPLVVVFCLQDNFPEANERSFAFLLEGLMDVKHNLAKRHIPFFVFNDWSKMAKLCAQACIVFTDKGYLKVEREWKTLLASNLDLPVIEVESNAIVPVEVASSKEEYGAFHLRFKLNKVVAHYLVPVQQEDLIHHASQALFNTFKNNSIEILSLEEGLKQLNIDTSVSRLQHVHGGETEANKVLDTFIANKLDHYALKASNPGEEYSSDLSPYLHFGHISPLEVYLQVMQQNNDNTKSFLEQLFVRRELSINFVYYNAYYNQYECLPTWAKNTLAQHESDKRDYVYSLEELERAQTHDVFWNVAQNELLQHGKMNSHMRMYWCKKILEWQTNPKTAYEIALYLNNKYALDGRDPNAFAGIAWCFGKHDRPWFERPIFGLVRYMNENGLKTKFDMNNYISKHNLKHEK